MSTLEVNKTLQVLFVCETFVGKKYGFENTIVLRGSFTHLQLYPAEVHALNIGYPNVSFPLSLCS